MMLKNSLRILAVGALVFAGALSRDAAAQPGSPLSERGYEQIRRIAQELDERARHANDQAQHRQYWEYRARGFLREVANFTRRASQFNARMATYRTRPWRVDDELRGLTRDGRAVETRLERVSRVATRLGGRDADSREASVIVLGF